ncbi:MAG: hypothetical protein LQ343_001136 [Gyalolechia ehrenbergii]|nr:MAG: hypothetical protein LQ343_001136 [Gyalolechia ehrenbergii]
MAPVTPPDLPYGFLTDPYGQIYFPNGTAIPGLIWQSTSGSSTVTRSSPVLWAIAWGSIGVSGVLLGLLLAWVARRRANRGEPSESLIKLWWMKLKAKKGVSGAKEGREIRMENLKNTCVGCTLLGRLLYRRLLTRRGKKNGDEAGLLPLYHTLESRDRRGNSNEGRRVRWGENMEYDAEMQDPVAARHEHGERGVLSGYEEVEQEGLGVRFVDVELGDEVVRLGRGKDDRGWWRR